MPRKAAAPKRVYQLKITLKDSKPPIWRRVEVPDDSTLSKLHAIIQAAMGWTDSHLHMFSIGRTSYGVPDPDYEDEDVRDERRVKLNQLLTEPKQKLSYEYDFGDSWTHVVLLEQVREPEPGVAYPRCTAGKRACPPEDCGGVWGYADFLAAITDPEHPEHDELREWAGGEFDPEEFDLAEIDAALRQ
ncbi:plasmid pRiA4b ORF-3 family protein [Oscillochloris sp. ZM17-4]|uniref:plasmid pRiA4b ORF-3 family protein n=1 Tax=Oscillochloris sp. ZM17-4 TaxID=2866714 RepID=UPI001C73D60D|nr:plasmid pRiA4b ORF-3 family protein [Oscillochloris sp. ZM17-4]MBX0328573.1 plasmid pRiA4b ORF-3 family protein [Oscillochloris sp. ZM17-4]